MKKNIFFRVISLGLYIFLLVKVCQFLQVGGVIRRLPLIAGVAVLLVVSLALVFVTRRGIRSRKLRAFSNSLLISAFVASALFAGLKMSRMADDPTSKLSYYVNKRSVTIKNDNLFKQGIDGIVQLIGNKVKLPQTLYLGNSFSLQYKANGTITKMDFSLNGNDQQGKTKSYLISYDAAKSDQINIYFVTYQGGKLAATAKLDILTATIEAVYQGKAPASGTAGTLNQLSYFNKHEVDYRNGSLTYIDRKHNVKTAENLSGELQANALRISPVSKTAAKTTAEAGAALPQYYILVDDLNNISREDPTSPESVTAEAKAQQKARAAVTTDDFFADKAVGYRFYVADAAAGSRFYVMEKTTDGGQHWNDFNQDPFLQKLGDDPRAVFVNADVGILILAHPGGDGAEAFLTTDGGKTTKQIENIIPQQELNGVMTAVYDTPTNLTQSDDQLVLEIGQGGGGINNNDSRFMVSNDMGKTWTVKK